MELRICDCTLRDGEQAAGVVFSQDEKVAIARSLDEAGVDQIEAGTPAMGREEQEAISAILDQGLRARVSTWNRALEGDIDASLASGARMVHICLPVSDIHLAHKLGWDRGDARRRLLKTASYALDKGLEVTVGFEDASRADQGFVAGLAGEVLALGVERVRYADTVSVLEPFSAFGQVGRLAAMVGPAVEFHAHNDYGLATANTLAALRAGCSWVSTTVTGVGERAGNAALEEIVQAGRHLLGGRVSVDPSRLTGLAELVAAASGRSLPPGKPVVGSHVFAHECGIHVDGILKESRTYEPFHPEEVGRLRQILIGKHSGRAALHHILANWGLSLNDDQARVLLEEVRGFAGKHKRALTGEELLRLYETVCDGSPALIL